MDICQHKDMQRDFRHAGSGPSLAHMWRVVYSETGVPESRIGPKKCACCESVEFTENNDYICLWCRFYEPEFAPYWGDIKPPEQWVCHICGQPLTDETSRCGSSLHDAPCDEPRGRAIRLSDSRFTQPTDIDNLSFFTSGGTEGVPS